MIRWEYLIQHRDGYAVGTLDAEMAVLNAMGDQGWELVHVGNGKDVLVLIWKRRRRP